METDNLLLTKRGDVVSKLLKSYSTSSEDRKALITKLLTSKNPMNVTIDNSSESSINRQILDRYLDILELKLEDDDE